MKFHENLKRICNEKGTTPTALLKKMGVATSKVTMWNNGGLPKEDMLMRLAKELDCSVMDFFEDDEDILPSAPTGIELDEDEKELVRIFRTLGRRERHEFMATAYEFEKRAEIAGDTERLKALRSEKVVSFEEHKHLQERLQWLKSKW